MSFVLVFRFKAGIGIEEHTLIDPQNIACKDEDILLGSVGYFYIVRCWGFDENGQLSVKDETEY